MGRGDTGESQLLVQVKARLVTLQALGPEAFKVMLVMVRLTQWFLHAEELAVPSPAPCLWFVQRKEWWITSPVAPLWNWSKLNQNLCIF